MTQPTIATGAVAEPKNQSQLPFLGLWNTGGTLITLVFFP
jgi:hypothetical protein